MGSPINIKRVNSAGVGVKPWIPLNRWTNDDLTINLSINGTATVTVEATLVQINRGGVPVPADIFPITNLTAITATTAANIPETPLEFIRVNQTAGTGSANLHVMQQGSN